MKASVGVVFTENNHRDTGPTYMEQEIQNAISTGGDPNMRITYGDY
jgi:hypothetical protein